MSTLLTELKAELADLQTAYATFSSTAVQEYSIAGRSVKRAEMKTLKADIDILRSRIARLESGAGRTVARFIPSTSTRSLYMA